MKWVVDVFEQAIIYKTPIILIEAFDVIHRIRHLVQMLTFTATDEKEKKYVEKLKTLIERYKGGVPPRVEVRVYTPREKRAKIIDLTRDEPAPDIEAERKEFHSYILAKSSLDLQMSAGGVGDSATDPRVGVKHLFHFTLDVIRSISEFESKYRELLSRAQKDENLRSRLHEEVDKLKRDQPLKVFILTGLPTTPDYRHDLDRFLKLLAYDYENVLLKSGIFVVIVDSVVPVSQEILNTGLVLLRRVTSDEEEVWREVNLFAYFFELRHHVKVSDELKKVLVDNLTGLPLTAVESVLTRLQMKGVLDISEIAQAKAEALASVVPFLEAVKLRGGLDDIIGGYRPIKEILKKRFIAVYKNPERAKRLGLKPGRGVLFFGPPGTGKSTFAKALAYELGLPTFRISETIFSSLYGETERNLKRTLEAVEAAAPAVLFFDECDKIFSKRGALQEHEVTRRVKDILLEWMADPDRKTIVVATTNLVQDLDEAFLRPERLELIIPVPYPDLASRKEIFKVHLKNVPHKLTEDDLMELARRTPYWTGDDIRYLVELAKTEAFERNKDFVTMEEFDEVFKYVQINIDERREYVQKMKETVQRYTRDRRLIELVEAQLEAIESASATLEIAESKYAL